MRDYKWILNSTKFARALDIVGKNATEEEVKAQYVKLGGKVALSDIVEPNMAEEIISEVTASEPVETITSEITSTNDTIEPEVNSPTEEEVTDNGGSDSIDDSTVTEA